jgi:hypothetical protein
MLASGVASQTKVHSATCNWALDLPSTERNWWHFKVRTAAKILGRVSVSDLLCRVWLYKKWISGARTDLSYTIYRYNARMYEGVSRSFRTGHLERELQMVQLSATRCSCIAILWVNLVGFAAITLCVASQRVFVVVSVYFFIDSVRKLLYTPSYIGCYKCTWLVVHDKCTTELTIGHVQSSSHPHLAFL